MWAVVVLLGHEEPGRTVLPQRSIDGNGDDAGEIGRWTRRQHREFLHGSVWHEGRREGQLGEIDQPVIVGRELGPCGCGSVR